MIHENPISYWYFFSMLFSSIILPGKLLPTSYNLLEMRPSTIVLPAKKNIHSTENKKEKPVLHPALIVALCYFRLHVLCFNMFYVYDTVSSTTTTSQFWFTSYLSIYIYIYTSYKPWLLASNAPYPNLPKCTERSNSKALESTQLPTERRKKSKKPLLASPRMKPLRQMTKRSRCGAYITY